MLYILFSTFFFISANRIVIQRFVDGRWYRDFSELEARCVSLTLTVNAKIDIEEYGYADIWLLRKHLSSKLQYACSKV